MKTSQCILYADDTTIYNSSDDIDQLRIQTEHDLSILADWFAANKLSLNVNKTNFILFNPKPYRQNSRHDDFQCIKLGNNDIKRVQVIKFLGIYIDQSLNWESHIAHISSKMSKGAYILKSCRRMLSSKNLRLLYFSLVHSHLLYGTVIWGNITKQLLRRLDVIQKKMCTTYF